MVAPDPVRRIGAYEIVSHLKSGGMASLYLAKRTGAAGFSRHVAIKVVHPHLVTDRAFVEMFIDEARLMTFIQNPNVVHVEEFGEDRGMYYLVMEYVHGCALSQLLRALAVRQRRFTPELATYLALQMADGLHAAHEARNEQGEPLHVVHRDVSPQNVLLSYAGHVKIIDFGIAKARSRSKETTTQSLKGKLRYMAPEQAFGRPVDRRTDVYALGVVLWEMLTVRRLFEADNDFLLLDQVRNPHTRPPSTFAEGVSPALDAAVLRALAPDPANRPQTMQEFRRMLAEAVPTAATLDAAHVADLLAVVMADDIEAKRQMVPESLSGIQPIDPTRGGKKAPTAQVAEEVLRTMTWKAANATLGVDEAPDSAPAPQQIVDAVFPAVASPSSVTERVERGGSARSSTPVVIAVLAVGLALVLAVLGVGLYLNKKASEPPVSAQPLQIAAPVAPVPIVPPTGGTEPPPQNDPMAGWGEQDDGAPSVDDTPVPTDENTPAGADTQHRPTGGGHHHHHDGTSDTQQATGETPPTQNATPPPDTTATQHGAIRIVHDVDFE